MGGWEGERAGTAQKLERAGADQASTSRPVPRKHLPLPGPPIWDRFDAMASLLSRLFGGGGGSGSAGASSTYKDFTIVAEPIKEGSQWRLAGSIRKSIDGEERARRFIRSDIFPSREQAESYAISKGELIIDQRGETMFDDPDSDRPL